MEPTIFGYLVIGALGLVAGWALAGMLIWFVTGDDIWEGR